MNNKTTPSKDNIEANVLVQYPLEEPIIVDLLDASNRNENFVVQDANENKYILRRYRRNADKARTMFQLKLQRHLLDNNFPTSIIIASVSDELMVIFFDTPWVLFTFVEGNEYDFTRLGQAAEAGRRLAQFHEILHTFQEEPVYLDFNLPLRDVCMKSPNDLALLSKMFFNQGIDEELSSCRGYWEKIQSDLPLTALDGLPSGWIHRDYHGRNMVFSGDEMCGLFDFDVVTEGPFAFDIARGMHSFSREHRRSNRVRPEFAQLFYKEYTKTRQITPEEKDAIPSLLLLAFMPETAYYEYRARDGDDVREMLKGDVRALARFEEVGAQLQASLTDL